MKTLRIEKVQNQIEREANGKTFTLQGATAIDTETNETVNLMFNSKPDQKYLAGKTIIVSNTVDNEYPKGSGKMQTTIGSKSEIKVLGAPAASQPMNRMIGNSTTPPVNEGAKVQVGHDVKDKTVQEQLLDLQKYFMNGLKTDIEDKAVLADVAQKLASTAMISLDKRK